MKFATPLLGRFGGRFRRILRAGVIGTAAVTATAAWGQTGGIEVRVFDTDGQTLPGATVTLTNAASLVAPTAIITDRQGVAEFPVLRVGGGYTIEVWFPDHARQRIEGIRVTSGEPQRIPFRLTAEINETVEVSGVRPVVDLSDTTATTKFSDQFIEALPVQGRFYQNVLALAPGVLDADGDGNPNVHGSRSRDFKTTVGGVSNVDPLTGERLSYVNPDSIEELKVIPAGAGVEYGRAQGGFGNILQKQGTNEFEGIASFLYSSNILDGNGATNVPESRIPDYQWLQPGIQISGPIVKDRVWFRFSHEWIRREEPVNTLRAVEVTGLEQTIASDQITWQVSPRNKLVVQYQFDPKVLTNVGVSSRVGADASRREEFGGPSYTLTWTAAQSPRLLVDSVVGFQDAEVNVLPSVEGVTNDCLINPTLPVLDDSQCFWDGRNQTSGSYPISSQDTRQRFTLSSQAEWEAGRWLGASHRLKFGFSAENERYYRTLEQQPDVLFSVDLFHNGTASYRLPFPGTSNASISGINWSVWLEDRFRIRSNLSVSLGLRIDQEAVDSVGWSPFDPDAEAANYDRRLAAGEFGVTLTQDAFTAYQDIQALQAYLGDVLQIHDANVLLSGMTRESAHWLHRRHFSDIALRNTNVAPRLSVSWDPWSDGKTKLFATAGRYYDKIFLGVPLIELEPETVTYNFSAHRNAQNRFVSTGAPQAPGAVSTRIVSRDLTTPYQDEWTAGFEREISAETSVKLMWIEREFKDQLQDKDVNHYVADYGTCIARAPWVSTISGPDGVLDDCYLGADGFPDQYINNPGWEDVLVVGNFNESNYRGLVLELTRRLYRNWQMNASYTWSHAQGAAEDFNQLLGNDRSTVEDEQGDLSYDQRHVLKASATTHLGGGMQLGGTVQWETGLPFSILETDEVSDAIPPNRNLGDTVTRLRLIYPTHHRNDQRNEAFWTWNARLAKDFIAGGSVNVELSLEVFNLLNDDALHIIDRTDGVNNAVRRFGRRWQIGTRIAF